MSEHSEGAGPCSYATGRALWMLGCQRHGSRWWRHQTLVGYETCSYSSTYHLNPKRSPEPPGYFPHVKVFHRSVHAGQGDGVGQPHLHSLHIVHIHDHTENRTVRGPDLASKAIQR